MTLTWPFWLILIIPAVLLLWLWPMPSRLLTGLRALTMLLLLMALCGLSLVMPSRRGVVVMVADRSLSMPAGSKERQIEAAALLQRSMSTGDQLAVVSFGQRTAVEQPPQATQFSGFVSDVGGDASNLAEAVELALSLVPPHSPGRLLVLSDGCATGRDVATAATQAAAVGIPVDYRSLSRTGTGDLAVERLDVPSAVGEGEGFLITAWVNSPRSQEVVYELRRNERVIGQGKRSLPTGRSRLVFRDKVADAGSNAYALSVRATAETPADPVPENNTARFLVGVRGTKPILCISPEGSSLAKVLTAGGLKIDRKAAEQCRWTLADLAGYSAVLIEDTPAGRIGNRGMESLAAWVKQAGGGLLTTGGRNAYGTGGYFKSPLEEVLPVSMELRREHRKFSLAIVVALDRSGSMAAPVPGGRMKMDLANLATAEVLNQLSAMDQFGCLAVDEKAHEIVPLSDVTDKAAMQEKILRIESMGGGIYVHEALSRAAAMIATAKAGTRHIILFSDANDSEEPGAYQALLEKITKAGITVSVIGLGTDKDVDAGLLKDIAKLGGGQCMFTEDANELPRLFAQDTFLVARSAFQEELTAVRATAGLSALTPQAFGELPQVGGYNLCYLRPGANLAAVTLDEYQAPLVAAWQAGSGRVLSFTGQADGPYSGPLAKWPRAGDFYSSLSRWVSPPDQGLGSNMLLTQDLRGSVCRVQLHLDSERSAAPFRSPPKLTVLRQQQGDKPQVEPWPLSWTSADVLSVDVPLGGDQTLLTSLEVPGVGRTTLPPVCLPYSAEYAPRDGAEGERTLQQLARATGGTERIDLASTWGAIPQKPRLVPLAPWLLLAATVVFLFEVLQRRTGLLSIRWRMPAIRIRRPRRTTAISEPAVAASRDSRVSDVQPASKGPSPASQETSAPKPEPVAPKENVADALAQARERARHRTRG
jgi:Mg-chelatase subunit ChlD